MQSLLAVPTNASSRFRTHTAGRIPALRIGEDIDDFLSSDLELSFASNMSLQSPQKLGNLDSDVSMDFSPAPIRTSTSENIDTTGHKANSRPRASTVNTGRLFGRDASNNNFSASTQSRSKSPVKHSQRSALPVDWVSQSGYNAPSSPNAMDVDTSFSNPVKEPFVDLSSPVPAAPSNVPAAIFDSSPAPLSAAPTIKGLDVFFEAASPDRSRDDITAYPSKKRRSISPPSSGRRRSGTIGSFDSSPAAASSPSALKLERIVSNASQRLGKPMLAGLGHPEIGKRPRRPALSASVAPIDSVRSAYPILDGAQDGSRLLPSSRRAFSAMLPPNGQDVLTSDDSSFDHSVDMSSPAAAHVKRQQTKTLRRCDGTDDFRPLTGLGSRCSPREQKNEGSQPRVMPEWGNTGLAGFGDNEAAGKVLPCHRVREDGLMRIKPATLDDLLDGRFSSQIESFQVIDCRFDYEFNGGHIPGAVNINTTQALEEYFLGQHVKLPSASTSVAGVKKNVLVFHCEFSVKRAPTFAKHLRSKDRSMNGHNYPNVFYPEIYVLEGGYCTFYKESRARNRPTGYVRMDDPHHAVSRKEDLDQFRKGKFGRTRSYAYGDGVLGAAATNKVPKRSSASTSTSAPLFPVTNTTRSRRGGALNTLTESRMPTDDEGETDIGDSPCPPPTKTSAFKGKRLGGSTRNATLLRAETFDPSRFVMH